MENRLLFLQIKCLLMYMFLTLIIDVSVIKLLAISIQEN